MKDMGTCIKCGYRIRSKSLDAYLWHLWLAHKDMLPVAQTPPVPAIAKPPRGAEEEGR